MRVPRDTKASVDVKRRETKRARPADAQRAKEQALAEHTEASSDTFEGDKSGGDGERERRRWRHRITRPQLQTKMNAHHSTVLVGGVEVGVRVDHVDPVNNVKPGTKLQWIADGNNAFVDVESVLVRKELKRNTRIELQGPGLTARPIDQGLPLQAQLVGVAATRSIASQLPNDDARAELKIEVKLTHRSIATLAGLAGAAGELRHLLGKIETAPLAEALGDALLTAVPIVSSVVALVSAKRALHTVRDAGADKATKALAVARAVFDATTVVFPLVGTLANLTLIGATVFLARRRAQQLASAPPTGPPPAAC